MWIITNGVEMVQRTLNRLSHRTVYNDDQSSIGEREKTSQHEITYSLEYQFENKFKIFCAALWGSDANSAIRHKCHRNVFNTIFVGIEPHEME